MKLGDLFYILTMVIAVTLCCVWDVIQGLRGKGIVDECKKLYTEEQKRLAKCAKM